MYLWLVEYDHYVHDQELATLKSLYLVDKFDKLLTNTSDGTFYAVCLHDPSNLSAESVRIIGCNSITESSTWNLDRASYANLPLGDDYLSLEKYFGMLEADLVVCERARFDSTPSSESGDCRIVGNDYLRRLKCQDRQLWPPKTIFQVAEHFNLAFRPWFVGERRARPCMCPTDTIGTADVTVKVLKYAHQLAVECPYQSSCETEGIFSAQHGSGPIRKQRRHDTLISALVPGFYMIPSHFSELYNIAAVNKSKLEDISQEKGPPSGPVVTSVSTAASGSLGSSIWRQIETFGRSIWSHHFPAQSQLGLRDVWSGDGKLTNDDTLKFKDVVIMIAAAAGACLCTLGIICLIRHMVKKIRLMLQKRKARRRQQQRQQEIELGVLSDLNAPSPPEHENNSRVRIMPPASAMPAVPSNGGLQGSAESTHGVIDDSVSHDWAPLTQNAEGPPTSQPNNLDGHAPHLSNRNSGGTLVEATGVPQTALVDGRSFI